MMQKEKPLKTKTKEKEKPTKKSCCKKMKKNFSMMMRIVILNFKRKTAKLDPIVC